jgi:hypothetical protein
MASARRHAGAVTVAATACAGLLVYYLHEHPERFASPTGPEKTSRRRRTRDALHDAGFFTSFGFVAASAVVFELASGKGVSRDWKWRMLIGYVAGNHALYAAHCLYGSARLGETGSSREVVEDDAGVGAMLRMSSRSAIRALFDEHRLADALVHAGAVVAGGVSLKRLDSLASLCEHLRRYADIKPARRKDETSKKGNAGSIWNRRWRDALAFWVAAAEREVFVSRRIAGTAKRTDATPPRSLSVADVVDVFAHCRTACKVLTFRELAFSLVFAEAARRALRLDLIKHHRE